MHKVQHPDTGMPALQFQHPTQAGPGNFGGWFEEQSMGTADAPKAAEAPKAEAAKAAAPKSGGKVLTMEEVEKHDSEEDCWIVVKVSPSPNPSPSPSPNPNPDQDAERAAAALPLA